jgi:hypothetical protein
MEMMIELTESELDEVAGGQASGSFSFSQTATGLTSATASGTLNQAATYTRTSATVSQSGTFSVSSS